ncbi:MAG TPA: hypothetical protein VLV45_10985 [Gemmatimonadales bacterium]|nr:hypothetical protein [Gemmatimonadales bacterium]
MNPFLMFADRDFDTGISLPWNEQALRADLGLDILLDAMADGDSLVHEVVRVAVLTGPGNDAATIAHRQAVLRDSLENVSTVRELYDIAGEAIESKRRQYMGIWGNYPSSVLHSSVRLLDMYLELLKRLQALAREHRDRFASGGFRTFFAMIERELTPEYIQEIAHLLDTVRFSGGTLLSAGLRQGNTLGEYVLHDAPHQSRRRSLWRWLSGLFSHAPNRLVYRVPSRDEAGARALAELRDHAIQEVANALAQSADHIENFFKTLRTEIAFYLGCVTLHARLTRLGEPTCYPLPAPQGHGRFQCEELYEPALALTGGRAVVGNSVVADGRNVVIVTGANRGGKSVFLRSVGIAQILMQCGMFAPARAFASDLCPAVVTHYKREEDPSLQSGKFDEELARLSEIVDHLTPNTILLLNESFAATNEREGSEIARQVVTVLAESGMRVFFVTHLYAFARDAVQGLAGRVACFRAERLPDGTRPFRIIPGEPLATSFGRDLYDRVFTATQNGGGQ